MKLGAAQLMLLTVPLRPVRGFAVAQRLERFAKEWLLLAELLLSAHSAREQAV